MYQQLEKKEERTAIRQPQVQRKEAPNRTGLPNNLKDGIERLSGYDMSDVKVHYNSSKPAQLNAHAYAQGTQIHLGSGQEKHLPHEAWHVVQQKQGRVRPTMQFNRQAINDNVGLEKEADVMGGKALQMKAKTKEKTALLGRHVQFIKSREEYQDLTIQKMSSEATIQRLVGFEAEYNIPTYGPAPTSIDPTVLTDGPEGDAPTPAIHQVLFNGLAYGQNRGHNGNFTLKPDHNGLQTATRNIRSRLSSMGFLLQNPAGFRSTSNLEYVTPALDELAVGSRTSLAVISGAINTHATAIGASGNARNNVAAIGAPANNTFTGVPHGDFQTWLGSRYNEVQAEVDAFRNAITDEFYIQATVGVIPSAIRDLHQMKTPNRAEDINTFKDQAMFLVNAAINSIETTNWFSNHEYIHTLKNGRAGGFMRSSKEADMITYESLMGVLHAIFMYMVGSALNQTNYFGSSRKNAVPFMSKMSNFRSIVSNAAPRLHANRPPDDLVGLISRAFNILPISTVDCWVGKGLVDLRGTGDNERVALLNSGTFVQEVLEKRLFTPRAATLLNTGRDRQFDNPDVMSQTIRDSSRGQAGAQFEHRYISDTPNTAGIGAVFERIAHQTRMLNTKHVDLETRVDVLTQAQT